jgi:polyhydroxyalkanoate synthesis regulator phasin
VVVGDRLDTDGAFASLLDSPFALVLSGVGRRRDVQADQRPAVVGSDLAQVVDDVLTGRVLALASAVGPTRDNVSDMPSDDRIKQYSEAGEEFFEAARSRAVEFLKELARVGQTSQGSTQGRVDDLVDAGRRSTEAFLDVVRREIASQLGQLGLATKSDLAELEARLGGSAPGGATSTPAAAPRQARATAGAPAAPPAKRPPAKRAAPAKVPSTPVPSAATKSAAGPAKRAGKVAGPAKAAGAAKAAGPAKKAAPGPIS